jgi:hypothetical protein
MTLNYLCRRLHLYFALICLPWIFMYGISAIPMTRPEISDGLYNHNPSLWVKRYEKPYQRAVPKNLSRSDLQVFGARVLEDLGIEPDSRSGAYRLRQERITVYVFDFWSYTRITYETDNQLILVEDKNFRWMHLLTGLHQRGGFAQGSFLNDLWSVGVDLVALGFVLWVASGIYMWWHVPRARKWGLIALASGCVLFVVFLIAL